MLKWLFAALLVAQRCGRGAPRWRLVISLRVLVSTISIRRWSVTHNPSPLM